MTNQERRLRSLAICLVLLAGYVDALGYISLGGLFVSYMSGNSTQLGIGIASRHPTAVLAGAVIAAFVVGGIIGSLVAHRAGPHEGKAVLTTVAGILTIAAILAGVHLTRPAAIAMAMAMGTENAVFEHDGQIALGLTYMTGALVKLGERIGRAFRGGDPFGWVWYLMLWVALVVGATIGSVVFPRFGLLGLWGAVVPTAVIAALWPRGNSGRVMEEIGRET